MTVRPATAMCRHLGKSSDATTAVVAMVLGHYAAAGNHAACLTGRPFAVRTVLDDPKQWIVPWRAPWPGLLAALNTMARPAIRFQCGTVGTFLLDVGLNWLKTGPVIVGPLDPLALWDRLEARFHGGASHWVVVLDRQGDRLVVHDPEGCPMGRLNRRDLARALDGGPPERGVLQLCDDGDPIPDTALMLISCISDGAALRSQHREDDRFGARGLRRIALALSKRSLSSAEGVALGYGLPGLCTGRFMIAKMLADLARLRPVWKGTSARASAHADLICRAAALTNRARIENQNELMVPGLERLAELEADLDAIIEDAPCS